MILKATLGIIFIISIRVSITNAVNIELQSYNLPDYYIKTAHRVHGGAVTIDRQVQPEIWKMISPGLCNLQGSVSIRIGIQNSSVYLRFRNGLVYAENNDDSSSFVDSACFYIRQNKWFAGHAAIESVYSPGYFLRHQYLQLKIHQHDSTTLFEKDASYRILQVQCKRFRSYNLQNHYFGLTGRNAHVSTTPQLWIPIRPGLAGHNGSVSFRSCYNARKFLRHSVGLIYSDNFHDSQLFRLDATFTERKRFYPGTVAYESVNNPNSFIRHKYGRLRIDSYSAAPLYKKDASYFEIN